MTDSTERVLSAIERGFARRGLPHLRGDVIYRLLLADGPMTSAEIGELLELNQAQLTGSDGALNHLLADGRVFAMHGHGPSRMYYAKEPE
jgi:DNA-binding transcriptional regulator GbsR (MarR family)